MTHLLDWIDIVLIGWVVVSALVTPVIGRFLGDMLSDPAGDATPLNDPAPARARRDTAEV